MTINYTFPFLNNILANNEVSVNVTNVVDRETIKISLSGLKIDSLIRNGTKYTFLFKVINRNLNSFNSVGLINYQRIINERNSNKSIENESIEYETNTIVDNSGVSFYANISEFTSDNENYSLIEGKIYLNIYLLDEEKSIISFKNNIEINLSELNIDETSYFENIINRSNNFIKKDLDKILGKTSLFGFKNNTSSLLDINNYSSSFMDDLDFLYDLNYSSMWQVYNNFNLTLYVAKGSDVTDTSEFMIRIKLNDLLKIYNTESSSIRYQKINSLFNVKNISNSFNNINLSILNDYINEIIITDEQNINNKLSGKTGNKYFSVYMTYTNFNGREIVLNSKNAEVRNIDVYRFIFNLLNHTEFHEKNLFNNLSITGNQTDVSNIIRGKIYLENNHTESDDNFTFMFNDKNNYYRFIKKSNDLRRNFQFFDKNIPKISFDKKIQDTTNRDVNIELYEGSYDSNNLIYSNNEEETSRESYNFDDLSYLFFDYVLRSAINNNFESNQLQITKELASLNKIEFLRMKISYSDVIKTVNINSNINYQNSYSKLDNSRYSFILKSNEIVNTNSNISLDFTDTVDRSIYFNLNLGNKLSFFENNKIKFDYDNLVNTKEFVGNFIVIFKAKITLPSEVIPLTVTLKKAVYLKDYVESLGNNWLDYNNLKIDLLNYEKNSERNISSEDTIQNINIIKSYINSPSLNTISARIDLTYSVCILNKHSYEMLYNSNIEKNNSSYFKIKNEIITLAREKDNSLSESNLNSLIESVYLNNQSNNLNKDIFMFDMLKKISISNIKIQRL